MENVKYEIEKEEAGEIRWLYEKKTALENLAKIVNPTENACIYDKLIQDYGDVSCAFEDWWKKIFKKYSVIPGYYRINFDTNEIFLENQK